MMHEIARCRDAGSDGSKARKTRDRNESCNDVCEASALEIGERVMGLGT